MLALSPDEVKPIIAELRKLYAAASPTERIRMQWKLDWRLKARPKQLAPEGDKWTKWGVVSGRGFGKTLLAAQWIAEQADKHPSSIWHVIAPTYSDCRYTCFEGPSGLLSLIPPELVEGYASDDLIIRLPNKAIIRGFSAEKPSRLRGPQCWGTWIDELASMQRAQEMWDMMMFGLRLGPHPRVVFTTTPRPTPIMRTLMKDPTCVITTGSTYENRDNLAPTFFDELKKYEGTTIGRQELLGELLDPEEQGIVKRSQIRMWPGKDTLPAFDYIVMSLDTAFTEATRDKETGDPDPTGCHVWGLFWHEKRANAMLLDAWEARLGFPDLIKRVTEEMKAEYGISEEPIIRPLIGPARVNVTAKKIDLLLIEDKGSGISLRQMLERQNIQAYAYNPGRADKLTRLHQVSHLFAAGVVWVPEGYRLEGRQRVVTGNFASWAQPAIDQWVTFSGSGSIPHDEHVDCCVTGDTKIFTPNGLREISQIAVGDEVLTHKGRWMRVTQTMTRQADDVFSLQAKTLDGLSITGNHPVYASYVRYKNAAHRFGETPRFVHAAGLKVRPTYLVKKGNRVFNSVQAATHDACVLPVVNTGREIAHIRASSRWKSPQIILRDDKISMRTKGHFQCNDVVSLNYDTGFVFGLYFAEGNLFRDDGIQFSCDVATLSHTASIIEREFGAAPAPMQKGKGCSRFVFHRMAWVPWFRDFGTGAAEKTIPRWVFDAPSNFIHGVIDGICIGDGTYRKSSDAWSITSISLSGLWMLRLLMLRVGIHSTICQTKAAGRRKVFDREFDCKTAYALTFYGAAVKDGSVCWVDGDAAYYVVSNVPKSGLTTVYNLTVDGDESYVTTGGAVHNCSQALRLLSDRNMLDQVRPKTAKDYAEEEADAAERYSREVSQNQNPYSM